MCTYAHTHTQYNVHDSVHMSLLNYLEAYMNHWCTFDLGIMNKETFIHVHILTNTKCLILKVHTYRRTIYTCLKFLFTCLCETLDIHLILMYMTVNISCETLNVHLILMYMTAFPHMPEVFTFTCELYSQIGFIQSQSTNTRKT